MKNTLISTGIVTLFMILSSFLERRVTGFEAVTLYYVVSSNLFLRGLA